MLAAAGFSALTRIVGIGCGLVASVLTARAMAPSERGAYVAVVVVAALVTQFASLGMASSNTWLAAKHPDRYGALVANTLWISFVLGIAGALVGGLLAWSTGMLVTHSALLLWILVLVPANLVVLLGGNLLVANESAAWFNLLQLIPNLTQLVVIAILAVAMPTPGAFVAASALIYGLTAVLLGIGLVRRSRSDCGFDSEVFRAGISFAFRAYLATGIGFLMSRGLLLILERQAGLAEVGQFSIALQVHDAVTILPQSAAVFLFPALVRAAGRGRAEYLARLRPLLVLIGTVAIIAAIIAPFGVPIVFGDRYRPGATMCMAILPGSVCLAAVTLLSQFVAADGMPWWYVWAWVAAAIVLSVCAGVLIPMFGGVGAAAAFTVANVILLLVVVIGGRVSILEKESQEVR